MQRFILFISLLVMTTIGCSVFSSDETKQDTGPVYEVPAVVESNELDGYAAALNVYFEGDYNWRYKLETRSDGSQLEYTLHLSGVDARKNPGDIRLVTDGEYSWMTTLEGEAECFQFPNDLDIGPAFLGLADLVDMELIADNLDWVGSEEVFGVKSDHYAIEKTSLDKWVDLELDLWQAKKNEAVYRYDLLAYGNDPLFDAGEGTIEAAYIIHDTKKQKIEPVEGCEYDVPLMRDAERITKFPGLISYESGASLEKTGDFYKNKMLRDDWEVFIDAQQTDDAIVMSYQRDGIVVDINIEKIEDGVTVEILFEN